MENLSEQAKRKMRYDATCKEVLSEKSMIACILQTCVEEFKGCSIKDIARHYIQGMPEVGTVVVEPDDGGALRIRNEQTEDKTQQEGTVFYDIRFTAIAPDSNKLLKLIINNDLLTPILVCLGKKQYTELHGLVNYPRLKSRA